MSKKLEKLIEYVINDEEEKARALFHDIVVEKSRQIYEEMMDQEEMSEAKEEDDEEDVTEAKEEDDDEEEVTESEEDDDEEEVTEDSYEEVSEMHVGMEGDASDQLMNDVEAEEEGMSEEDDFADETGFDDSEGDMDAPGEGDLEDRVVDLEDKLDELMAEFEQLMGDEGMDDMDDMGGDEFGDEGELDLDGGEDEMGMGDEDEMGMMEAVSLKAAPKPTTSEEGGINKKSIVAANSGSRGMEGKPVHTGTSMGGKHDTSAYSNSHKDLISDFQNKAGSGMKDMKAAPKPHTAQATGVNTKSPLKGR